MGRTILNNKIILFLNETIQCYHLKKNFYNVVSAIDSLVKFWHTNVEKSQERAKKMAIKLENERNPVVLIGRNHLSPIDNFLLTLKKEEIFPTKIYLVFDSIEIKHTVQVAENLTTHSILSTNYDEVIMFVLRLFLTIAATIRLHNSFIEVTIM